MSDGIDQNTGAVAASPASATVIQATATVGSCVVAAPSTASPSSIPMMTIHARTRLGSFPRFTR